MAGTEMTYGLDDVVALFTDADVWWAIGGGWAVDLHLGSGQRRHHKDVDLICLRSEAEAVRAHLSGWDLHRLVDGELEPWVGPLGEAHQIWARPGPADEWAFEVLFEGVTGNEWRFRRNPDVTIPFGALRAMVDGVPAAHLGASLLYKAKRDADLDLEDLLASMTAMSVRDRAWLANAVRSTHGAEHRWVAVLAAAL